MSIFYTSDTHFGHKRMLEYRGFATTEEMDEELIKRWNARVCPKDTVFHLGDFSFLGLEATKGLIKRLNGHICLVPGNHDDHKMLNMIRGLDPYRIEVMPTLYERKGERHLPDRTTLSVRMVLCHFPMWGWNRAHYGAMHLHGHSHGSCIRPGPTRRVMDVGVDCHNLAPISSDEVMDRLLPIGASSCDHHRVRDL